jgi:hypothetical protein
MPWTEGEKDSFYKQLTVLAETLGEPMTPVRLAGYCSALEDLPLAGVAIGMRDAMRKCRFFPKPTEIRELMALSQEWRRFCASVNSRDREARRLAAGPPMTREETEAAFGKLSQALKGLSARKRMR